MSYANSLTILRILLVPVLVLLISRGAAVAALCTFFAAGLTDLLDGWIARRWGQRCDMHPDNTVCIGLGHRESEALVGILPAGFRDVARGFHQKSAEAFIISFFGKFDRDGLFQFV